MSSEETVQRVVSLLQARFAAHRQRATTIRDDRATHVLLATEYRDVARQVALMFGLDLDVSEAGWRVVSRQPVGSQPMPQRGHLPIAPAAGAGYQPAGRPVRVLPDHHRRGPVAGVREYVRRAVRSPMRRLDQQHSVDLP